jgi:hypothetical protein
MKTKQLFTIVVTGLMLAGLTATAVAKPPVMKMTTPIRPELTTPDKVETSIGTLKFFDGVPTEKTVKAVYENLDRMRGVEAYLNTLSGVSAFNTYKGQSSIGAINSNQVVIFDKLMDSKAITMTSNTSTLYASYFLNPGKDGPIVLELPPQLLGMFNDMWFRYVVDLGPAGPDKGKGGKYLILPPGYKDVVPSGYFVVKSPTNKIFSFVRASTAKGLPAGVALIKTMKIYPLAEKDNPIPVEWISGSDRYFSFVPPNDYSYYEDLNNLIQEENMTFLDAETRGLLAAIGIVKGKPFNPDARMKKILTEAVAIGNATVRSLMYSPREKGYYFYPETDSSWTMAFANKDTAFEVDGAANLDARPYFYNFAIGVTPAMAVPRVGTGSDYAYGIVDADKKVFDGSKTYKLHLPPNIPINNFWAVTIYDTQTRSMLQTDQQFPTRGSQSEGFIKNADGSYDLYFGPKAPKGQENNWLQTIPGKSWFIILRMYGPLQPWIDKTWRPDEIELLK